MVNRSIEFFDAQFRRQIPAGDFRLNPFEERALEHLTGTVLDLGCGLGNLALEAARRGHTVDALDASAIAIERIDAAAKAEELPVRARVADLASWRFERSYSTIVSIGLFMFFRRERALELLADLQQHVEPGGRAVVNVLTEGTTFLDMFQSGGFTLFACGELERRFAGWTILSSAHESFPAPGDTLKEFETVIAAKPST